MYITSRPLASRVIGRSHLEGLKQKDMEGHLKHHLEIAGINEQLFSDEAILAIGTVCPRTGAFFACEASHCDTPGFQTFLKEAAECIVPTRKRNILILDNTSWHKGKKLDWHFFEPIYLPHYSPDFNPIERIWLIMKAEYFPDIHCRNKDALIARSDQALCALMNDPKKVASAATPIVQ
jgi:transposase